MPLYNKYKWDIFESDHSYVLWDLLGEDKLSQIKKLNLNLGDYFTLYLAVYDEQDNFAGCGVLVHLHYSFSETRRKIMDYRSGLLKPNEDLRKLFKM